MNERLDRPAAKPLWKDHDFLRGYRNCSECLNREGFKVAHREFKQAAVSSAVAFLGRTAHMDGWEWRLWDLQVWNDHDPQYKTPAG